VKTSVEGSVKLTEPLNDEPLLLRDDNRSFIDRDNDKKNEEPKRDRHNALLKNLFALHAE
jgi:hypothetical protein